MFDWLKKSRKKKRTSTDDAADWALARGYNYSPRLHVDLWGNGWGK